MAGTEARGATDAGCGALPHTDPEAAARGRQRGESRPALRAAPTPPEACCAAPLWTARAGKLRPRVCDQAVTPQGLLGARTSLPGPRSALPPTSPTVPHVPYRPPRPLCTLASPPRLSGVSAQESSTVPGSLPLPPTAFPSRPCPPALWPGVRSVCHYCVPSVTQVRVGYRK